MQNGLKRTPMRASTVYKSACLKASRCVEDRISMERRFRRFLLFVNATWMGFLAQSFPYGFLLLKTLYTTTLPPTLTFAKNNKQRFNDTNYNYKRRNIELLHNFFFINYYKKKQYFNFFIL